MHAQVEDPELPDDMKVLLDSAHSFLSKQVDYYKINYREGYQKLYEISELPINQFNEPLVVNFFSHFYYIDYFPKVVALLHGIFPQNNIEVPDLLKIKPIKVIKVNVPFTKAQVLNQLLDFYKLKCIELTKSVDVLTLDFTSYLPFQGDMPDSIEFNSLRYAEVDDLTYYRDVSSDDLIYMYGKMTGKVLDIINSEEVSIIPLLVIKKT